MPHPPVGAVGVTRDAEAGRRAWPALCALVVAAVPLAALRRVVVDGDSMVPALEPGDRLLVVRLPRRWPLRPGDVVTLADPRRPDRLLVKRVAALAGGAHVVVAGDNPIRSTDSRVFGPVERRAVNGLALYRYAPAPRAGRVDRVVPSPPR